MLTEEMIKQTLEEAEKRLENLKMSSEWYKCPKCERTWARISIEGIVCDDFDPPKNPKMAGKQLCPDCDEIIFNGIRFGGREKLLIENGSNINDLRCPLCKGELKIDVISGYGLCKCCGCLLYTDFGFRTGEIFDVSFRENLTRKEFKKALEKSVEILKTEGVPIKGKQGRKKK